MRALSLAVLMIVVTAMVSQAQTKGTDYYSPQELMQKGQALNKQAHATNNVATEILDRYPGHFTELAYRFKDGQAEQHATMADIFIVLDGSATLLSGGEIVNAKTSGPGEVRGDSVRNGNRQKLNKGDIVHIPAGLPHQLVEPSSGGFTYFIVKAEEKH